MSEVGTPTRSGSMGPVPYAFRTLSAGQTSSAARSALKPIVVRLGTAQLDPADDSLKTGQVVRLDRKVDDLVELRVDGRVVACGRLVIVNDRVAVQVVESLFSSSPPDTADRVEPVQLATSCTAPI